MIHLLWSPPAAERERTLALAGLFQAIALVQRTARYGQVDQDALATSITSVLRLDADSTIELYGSLSNLRVGFDTLVRQLDRSAGVRDIEITRYASTLMVLERALTRDSRMLDRIRAGVIEAGNVAPEGQPADPAVLAVLADCYRATLSTIAPRIMVSGDPGLLNESGNAAQIRALLLAGIRSAVLWRQLGGSRRRLLFTRRQVVKLARAALEQT